MKLANLNNKIVPKPHQFWWKRWPTECRAIRTTAKPLQMTHKEWKYGNNWEWEKHVNMKVRGENKKPISLAAVVNKTFYDANKATCSRINDNKCERLTPLTTQKYVYHHHCFFPIRNMLMWCVPRCSRYDCENKSSENQQQQQHLVLNCVTTNITVVDLCAAVGICVILREVKPVLQATIFASRRHLCAHTKEKHPVSICSTLEQHFVRAFFYWDI